MTSPQQSQVGGQDGERVPEVVLDEHLDAVLRASGSALKFYSLPGVIHNMRASMRMFEETVRARHAQAAAPALIINGEPATAHSLLAALIDIFDDQYNNAPEHRCYVDGAWGEALEAAREFLAAPTQAAAPGVQGWKLVPVEPTEEMFIEGMEADCLGRPSVDDETHVRSIWDRMLAAAPPLPESQPLYGAEGEDHHDR